MFWLDERTSPLLASDHHNSTVEKWELEKEKKKKKINTNSNQTNRSTQPKQRNNNEKRKKSPQKSPFLIWCI